jgi:hypothetical protein
MEFIGNRFGVKKSLKILMNHALSHNFGILNIELFGITPYSRLKGPSASINDTEL